MANSDVSPYAPMRHLDWSHAEKVIARKAFDRALQQELESLIQEVKNRVAKITEPSELWDLEGFLTERRKQIDFKYDYRYSVLPEVFGRLISEGRLREQDLRGLGEDKLDFARKAAAFMKRAG